MSQELNNKMPSRVLGKTGRKLSVIGFGGIIVMNAEEADAKRIVADAVENGVNYFDVAPDYGDAEVKLGPALKPFREDCFLACKTGKRDKAGAKEELDNSLKTLETDHLDLYQLHGLIDVEKDVKAALGKGGAIETFVEARKAGVIRHLGFSAHTVEAAITAMNEFDFDTILYPVNFSLHYNCKFEQEVLAEAKKRNMGILAIKSMALRKRRDEYKEYSKCWYEPITEAELARKALGWTLGQGVTALLPPGEVDLFRMAMKFGPELAVDGAEYDAEFKELAAGLDSIFSV